MRMQMLSALLIFPLSAVLWMLTLDAVAPVTQQGPQKIS